MQNQVASASGIPIWWDALVFSGTSHLFISFPETAECSGWQLTFKHLSFISQSWCEPWFLYILWLQLRFTVFLSFQEFIHQGEVAASQHKSCWNYSWHIWETPVPAFHLLQGWMHRSLRYSVSFCFVPDGFLCRAFLVTGQYVSGSLLTRLFCWPVLFFFCCISCPFPPSKDGGGSC